MSFAPASCVRSGSREVGGGRAMTPNTGLSSHELPVTSLREMPCGLSTSRLISRQSRQQGANTRSEVTLKCFLFAAVCQRGFRLVVNIVLTRGNFFFLDFGSRVESRTLHFPCHFSGKDSPLIKAREKKQQRSIFSPGEVFMSNQILFKILKWQASHFSLLRLEG